MKEKKRNLPASVTARLLNQARQTGTDYQILLTNFCFERFLYRLGESQARDRFVLKGAMLLRVYRLPVAGPTPLAYATDSFRIPVSFW